MSRNRRALVTAALGAVAGLAGMALAGNYSDTASKRFGALRPVVVAIAPLPAGTTISPDRARQSVETRRIPARFAPTGSFGAPAELIGLRTAVELAPGTYVTSAMFGAPDAGSKRRGRVPKGVVPIELSVHGAGALPGRGRRVDVLVSTPDATGGDSDTTVAARGAVLLDLAPGTEVGTEPGTGRVTLGLARRAAIRLVDAEASGHRITLIPVDVG